MTYWVFLEYGISIRLNRLIISPPSFNQMGHQKGGVPSMKRVMVMMILLMLME